MRLKEMKFVESMKQILENNIEVIAMRYVEMTVEHALKICNKNDKVLVAVHDLENDDDCNIIFVKKKKDEYDMLFNDVKTVASACDDFVKQLKCFTEKQNIYNIKPNGFEKIILLE